MEHGDKAIAGSDYRCFSKSLGPGAIETAANVKGFRDTE